MDTEGLEALVHDLEARLAAVERHLFGERLVVSGRVDAARPPTTEPSPPGG